MRRGANAAHVPFTPQTIVPPHIFEHLARLPEARWPGLAERARESLVFSAEMRAERGVTRHETSLAASVPRKGLKRALHDAEHGFELPGRIVRREGEEATGDVSVDEAYDALGATWTYFSKVHERDSIDGKALPLEASVHYRRAYNNAFWNGTQMVFGDGDGRIFGRFTQSLDVIGHELTHGVTQYEAGLEYQGQSGALNEHMSDVFGSLVKQYALGQTAKKADWLIGEGLWAPGIKGRALRSMKAPGTAYDDPRIGRDPQPAHMDGYVDTVDDNGGVHLNSGIPNHAFYLASIGFGGKAWEKAGRVWYRALTSMLRRDADFMVAAAATVEAAGELYDTKGATIVRTAWKQVGIEVGAGTRKKSTPASGPKLVRRTAAVKTEGAAKHAHPRRTERRDRRAS